RPPDRRNRRRAEDQERRNDPCEIMTVFKSIDPTTEAVNWEGQPASPAQVQSAVDAARTAFPDWADRPRAERIDAVKRYQTVLKDRAPQIAEAI
ncbi:aldehyde dehydrogenase family protein, partial [Staphylococcus aureus]|nr:aldehyde dehydrogenase family protein [Staphylococcus aureus]